MNHPISDAGIPLLTEVIPPAAPSPLISQPKTVEEPVQSDEADAAQASSARLDLEKSGIPALPVLNEPSEGRSDARNWERLEREIRERISTRLRIEIDTVVEQRMQETLADLLQIAVDSITSEVRQNLQQAISDTVSQAVATEISLLKERK